MGDGHDDKVLPPYVSTLSAAAVARLRGWHEAAYDAMHIEAGAAGQTFDYLGLTLHVPPEVQPITAMSRLLGEAVLAEVRPGDRVLDLGTGCGVNAILAAGTASEVMAVDLNPIAVRAAQDNAERNGRGPIDVRVSDVFSTVDGEFDLIIVDPPFRWFAPRDLLESAITDDGYRMLRRFFAEVSTRLADSGRILLFFGSSGDVGYLWQLIAAGGFAAAEVARQSLVRDGAQVDYVTLRLSRAVPPDATR